MNWKKALLVSFVVLFGLVMLVAVGIGLLVTGAVISVAESGVVDTVAEAVDEAVAGAERVEVQVDVPRITVTEADDEAFAGAERVEVQVDVPRITVTDLDSGSSRVITPDLPRRIPRVVVETPERLVIEAPQRHVTWSHWVLSPITAFFRGVTTLLALALVVAGAWLLLKNRRQAKNKAETI